MWPLLRVILLPDMDDLEDEIWNLQVMLEWVRTLGEHWDRMKAFCTQDRGANVHYLVGNVTLCCSEFCENFLVYFQIGWNWLD